MICENVILKEDFEDFVVIENPESGLKICVFKNGDGFSIGFADNDIDGDIEIAEPDPEGWLGQRVDFSSHKKRKSD